MKIPDEIVEQYLQTPLVKLAQKLKDSPRILDIVRGVDSDYDTVGGDRVLRRLKK